MASTRCPMNYDFGKHWTTKIKPLLDDPKIRRSIKAGVNGYLSLFPGDRTYEPNTCPASYTSKDGYCMLIDRKGDMIMKQLKASKQLPREYLKLERQLLSEGDDADWCRHDEMKHKILAPFIYDWNAIKYD